MLTLTQLYTIKSSFLQKVIKPDRLLLLRGKKRFSKRIFERDYAISEINLVEIEFNKKMEKYNKNKATPFAKYCEEQKSMTIILTKDSNLNWNSENPI